MAALSPLLFAVACGPIEDPSKPSRDPGQVSIPLDAGDRQVSFEWPDGTYWSSRFEQDFGNINEFSDEEKDRADISSESLRVRMPPNKIGSDSGIVAFTEISPGTEYTLEYRVKFHSEFDWSMGGKIPGLSGGDHNTGGEPATDGKGWSVRLMWRENGRLIPYVYHRDQLDQFGDTFGVTLHSGLQRGTWYRVKIHVRLNTSDDRNGMLKIWINDELKLSKSNIRYVTVDSKRNIDWLHWSVFRGGSTMDWASPDTGYVYLDDVRLNRIK